MADHRSRMVQQCEQSVRLLACARRLWLCRQPASATFSWQLSGYRYKEQNVQVHAAILLGTKWSTAALMVRMICNRRHTGARLRKERLPLQ